ncbi:MAG: hypothetical protein NTX49_07165 [Chlamydiae bacterium]|nr:hypothetical protein [Chlamydiota bacterium]
MTGITPFATLGAQEAPLELRAPSRARIRPPVEDLVERTRAAYEKTSADLRAQFEKVEQENTGLRKEAAERDDRFARITVSSRNAINFLLSESALNVALQNYIDLLYEAIGNARKTLSLAKVPLGSLDIPKLHADTERRSADLTVRFIKVCDEITRLGKEAMDGKPHVEDAPGQEVICDIIPPSVQDAIGRATAALASTVDDLIGKLKRVEGENAGLRKEAAEMEAHLAEATATIATLSEKLNEAREKGAYRAPARRISVAAAADRTTAAFERMIADLKGRIERVEGENVALKAEAAERECRFTEITEAGRSVIGLIHSQTATYKFLTYKIKCLCEVIDNARKILATAPK